MSDKPHLLTIYGDWPPSVAVAPDAHVHLTDDDRFEIWREDPEWSGCGGDIVNRDTGERLSIASLIRAALPEGDPRYSAESPGMLDRWDAEHA